MLRLRITQSSRPTAAASRLFERRILTEVGRERGVRRGCPCFRASKALYCKKNPHEGFLLTYRVMHLTPKHEVDPDLSCLPNAGRKVGKGAIDIYFSADVETDGPIPGPFSILSFALVEAGSFDGLRFERHQGERRKFYRELKPISAGFQADALRVNGFDRDRLVREGEDPEEVMTSAAQWVNEVAGTGQPVLVAYPLSFDWAWLYWYFVQFSRVGSPFNHSRCFDIKTAFAIKAAVPISEAGRSRLFPSLRPEITHTHHALDDAIEQAEIFANIFEWEGVNGRPDRSTSAGD